MLRLSNPTNKVAYVTYMHLDDKCANTYDNKKFSYKIKNFEYSLIFPRKHCRYYIDNYLY